ncbi:protocatechuate 3,4-dioxygenase subunit alpha [Streptomyces sp. MST-110588]|uniref:dioxygenase family protein n=1 Tax=Streptomyces sp. MST-110588 TaxID=2833628 RepID=UPI001F5D2443|nr:protocatechuate 3,4-dioxygenase subunit alpha [Streptomyces sp. MST-110588]UNO39379.1 protocatechuate 3,4-dioxygenase subunit alpha [Streptomyces sp. MST-110588]
MPGTEPAGTTPTGPTPSQTIGPFFGHALPLPGGGQMAPAGHPDALTLHGRVLDGAGAPVPDALLEFWQTGPDDSPTQAPSSLFGRVPTDADGHYAIRTLPPAAPAGHPTAAPYIAVCVHARGLLHHLFTRVYFPGNAAANATDPLLTALPDHRARTLLARAEAPYRHRFDIRLRAAENSTLVDQESHQAHEETVFLTYTPPTGRS